VLGINNLSKKDEFSVENSKIIEDKFRWGNNISKLYNFVK
jgi:hypothetical protein